MNRVELQNAIIQLERDLDRNSYHVNGSRNKYMDTIYLSEAAEDLLFAFRAHLLMVQERKEAERVIADALDGVELDGATKKRLAKMLK